MSAGETGVGLAAQNAAIGFECIIHPFATLRVSQDFCVPPSGPVRDGLVSENFKDREMNKHWYVFYTKSRQEKKVKELLQKGGFEVFLPMQKVMRQWSDRKKKVELPLFNSYIFVKDLEHRIGDILKIPGVAWNIRHNGRPAILRQEEYELIQRFITTGYFLETSGEVASFEVGDRAKVIDGPLAGVVGVLTGQDKNNRFSILLEGIQQVIQVQLPASLLARIGQ